MNETVSIILLNYRTPQDTLECLKSLLELDCEPVRIIVADNASDDGSLDVVAAFLRGETAPPSEGGLPDGKGTGAVRVRVPHVLVQEWDMGQGVDGEAGVVLLQNEHNTGYGGGNNRALRYARACNDSSWYWLVNSDTVVDRGALTALMDAARKRPGKGIFGSSLRYYHDRDRQQALGGGRYYPLLGRARLHGKGKPDPADPDAARARAEAAINYVMGASLLLSEEVLRDTGGFDETFFLYTEEVDLAKRAMDKGYGLGVAPDSLVYHKAGASTRGRKGELFWYHLSRSGVIYLRKHWPAWTPMVLGPFHVLLNLLHSRSLKAMLASWQGMRDGMRAGVEMR